MKSLSKSASGSGLAPAVALGLTPGIPLSGSGNPLQEGTLYVARSASSSGPAAWEPYRFAHHTDGSLSFRPIRAKSESLASYRRQGSRDEFFLDADWRQPFIAAPWKPVSSTSLHNAKDAFGGDLYPFTLSYAPARPKPGDTDIGRRRTVVLAAPTSRARAKWMETLARKAHSPELRSGAPANLPGAMSGPSSRRIAALGEEHIGLPVTMGRNVSVPRLSAGPPSLFDSHSSLSIVRDLLDGYAADPLSQNSKRLQISSTDSDSSRGTPSVSQMPKSKFLSRYLDRQAEIEHMLDHKWSGGGSDSGASAPTSCRASAPEGNADDASPQPAVFERSVEEPIMSDKSGCDVIPSFPPRIQLADSTSNVALDNNILFNTEWSGGAIFAPPDARSFRLTICPLDGLEDHPIFIGIAPSDADLSMVSFFSSGGGVMLCAGGHPSDDLISALGAPGGPAFFCFGERHFSSLPTPKPGQSISVHYIEGENCGELRFFVSTAEGEEVMSDRPPLPQGVPLASWRPCVLLSMPETRVHVVRLI